jgi:acyl-CoA thioesterase FadM
VAAAFDYKRPLRFEDEVDITIRIVKKSARSIGYQCVLRRGDDLIATGTMTIVCVDRRTQPLTATPFPDAIANRFEVALGTD